MPTARQESWTSHCQQLHAEEKATVPRNAEKQKFML